MNRARLDLALVSQGLVRSRGAAQDLIAAGAVEVNGVQASKPSTAVSSEDELRVTSADSRFVGRAAAKLEAALAHFAVEVEGLRCADVGASTGGFTQILLERGASQVAAIDVGHDQLAPQLAADPRVSDFSGTSIRDLDPATIGGAVDLVVVDLSFISLSLVTPDVARLLRPGGSLIALIKPQFELSKGALDAAGVVRRAQDRERAIIGVLEALREAGLTPAGLIDSPILGKSRHRQGNREYLVLAHDIRVHEGGSSGPQLGVVTPSWEALLKTARQLAKESP